MSTVTKKELIDRIARNLHLNPATVKAIMQELTEQITHELTEDNRLELRDFGIFEPHTRKARSAKNPRTQEPVNVPAKRAVRFKMGRKMREKMNDDVSK